MTIFEVWMINCEGLHFAVYVQALDAKRAMLTADAAYEDSSAYSYVETTRADAESETDCILVDA